MDRLQPSATARASTPNRDGEIQLDRLVQGVRSCVRVSRPARDVAARVARELRDLRPEPSLLSASQRAGEPDGYSQYVLHVEPTGEFSIVALVWRPGQATPVHDHVSWCVVAVIQGTESETTYAVRRREDQVRLEVVGHQVNGVGAVCSLAPPGDIHAVSNKGSDTAISLHVYGADLSKLGTSIRRVYDLPITGDSS